MKGKEASEEKKLPKLAAEQRSSIASNYSTLAVKPSSKHSRYLSKQQDPAAAFNSQDFQKTLHSFRAPGNQHSSRTQQKHTLYYTDSKPRSKQQSFHWNLGTPRNPGTPRNSGTPRKLSLGRPSLPVSPENSR